jgi:tetratricopeptide (TPR) repeat protein
LPDFSRAFRVDKMRSGIAAIYQLKEEFETFTSAPQKLDSCESIARCLFQLEQYGDAAEWYEAAGRIIMSEPSTTPAWRAFIALGEYESALECYRRGRDTSGYEECSVVIGTLRKASAPA